MRKRTAERMAEAVRAPKRDRRMDLRLSGEDWDRLDALVQHYELPRSTVIRMLLKARADQLQEGKR